MRQILQTDRGLHVLPRNYRAYKKVAKNGNFFSFVKKTLSCFVVLLKKFSKKIFLQNFSVDATKELVPIAFTKINFVDFSQCALTKIKKYDLNLNNFKYFLN